MSLSAQVYETPDKARMLANLVDDFRFSSNEHGFAALEVPLTKMDLVHAFAVYDWPGTPHVEVYDQAGPVWIGRLEDIAILPGGVGLAGFGYARALRDVPYTALWSTTSVSGWREVTNDDDADYTPEKYEFNKNNRLYMSLKKNEAYVHTGEIAGFAYYAPDGGEMYPYEIVFDYDMTLPANWIMRVSTYNAGYSGGVVEDTVVANGSQQTGAKTLTLTSNKEIIVVQIRNVTGSTYTNAAETGDWYAKITNVRVKALPLSIEASEIAAGIVSFVSGVNPGQLSASTALIETTSEDMLDELYEDALPADILDRLALLHGFEWGIWENRWLHFREKGSQGRNYNVDVTRILRLERSLDAHINSAYAVYRDTNGRNLRTAAASNQTDIDRYGVTRRAALSVNTTGQAQAEAHRDTLLADKATYALRAEIEIDQIFNENGAPVPLHRLRAGDSLTMRNLPPLLSADVDNIRSFRLAFVEVSVRNGRVDVIRVEPEVPAPTLVTLVARREAGLA